MQQEKSLKQKQANYTAALKELLKRKVVTPQFLVSMMKDDLK